MAEKTGVWFWRVPLPVLPVHNSLAMSRNDYCRLDVFDVSPEKAITESLVVCLDKRRPAFERVVCKLSD